MSVRHSEYPRSDEYFTPQWVFDALHSVEDFAAPFDAAPRHSSFDFFTVEQPLREIVTNPPFSVAEDFCRHALSLTRELGGKVALLLPMAFDAAKGRIDLFAKRPSKIKYVLTKRIRWENLEQKVAGPSMNHAWYVWDWNYVGPPMRGYL